MTDDPGPSRNPWPLALVTGFVLLVGAWLVLYRPDRPVPAIVPGSSPGPAFVVQVLRPRAGLPLGGILPPGLFGVDAQLGFDSSSPGVRIETVGPRRLELAADGWDLRLVVDPDGRVSPETRVVFQLVFEERPRRVRCRPADPAVGTLSTTALEDGAELAGRFDVELAHCEDAETGEALGWPPRPFVLHGSFDRLPLR